jgi:hypothetical protein
MRNGRRWLALDADLMSNPFTLRLFERFGSTGVVLWVAFLCACKRSRKPGVLIYTTDAQARDELRIIGLKLTDENGGEWTLDDLWRFTGRQKQTSRRRHGGVTYVACSHWGRWQKDAQRQANAQRMATVRRAQAAHTTRTGRAHDAHMCAPEIEREIDIPLTPAANGVGGPEKTQGASPPAPHQDASQRKPNPRAAGTNPRARGTNPRSAKAEAHRERIVDWVADPPVEDVIDPVAVETLRATLRGDEVP